MIETTEGTPTRAGAMEAFIVRPERGAPAPAVPMLMDAPGFREELRDMACVSRRPASACRCRNPCCRAGRGTLLGPGAMIEGDPERARMRATRTRMTIPPVMEDVADRIAFLGRVGIAAQGRIVAAASFCGTWLVSDAEENPHLTFARGRAGLHIGCAEHDDLAPLPMVGELRRHFEAAGSPGEIGIHPGAHHGFAFPSRWCLDKPAVERHRERLAALYRRRLSAA